MSFLVPTILWLLPLSLLPLLIHLLSKQRSKRIDFPSLKFLKMLQQDALRRFNLKQLIILLLRIAMILLLILAAAQPVLDKANLGSWRFSPANLAVVLVDNTASTRDWFSEEKLRQLDNSIQYYRDQGFDTYILTAADTVWLERISHAVPSWSDPALTEPGVFFASNLDLDRYLSKEVLIISDGQHLDDWKLDLDTTWTLNWVDIATTLDLSIFELDLPPQSIRPDERFEIAISTAITGERREGYPIELFLDELRVNQAYIAPEDPAIQTIRLQVQAGTTRLQRGRVGGTGDDLIFNNNRYFVMPSLSVLEVLVIRSRTQLDHWRLLQEATRNSTDALNLRLISHEESENSALPKHGTIILESSIALPDYQLRTLAQFVRDGGQLILFGPIPVPLAEQFELDPATDPEFLEEGYDLDLTSTGSNRFGDLPFDREIRDRRIRISRRYLTAAVEAGRQDLIRFDDDLPFSSEFTYGSGRILWFNTDLDLESSSLVLRGLFPTMIRELVETASPSAQVERLNTIIGDTLVFFPYLSAEQEGFRVLRPDGITEFVQPDSQYKLQYTRTDVPGIYDLFQDRQIVESIAVNISREEALPPTGGEFEGVNRIAGDSPESLYTTIQNRRDVIALWPHLLWMLLICFIAETVLSRITRSWRQT